MATFQDSSIGIAVEATVGPPTNGALTQTVAGSLGAVTNFVKCTWVSMLGETLASAETSLATSANNVLNVAAPASPPAGAIGWNVYVSTTTGTETKQNSVPIAVGTPWVEPTTGLIAGSAVPVSAAFGSYGNTTTPVRWLEFVDENLDWRKNIKQGQGLRVGGRVARSARRTVPSADGGGDITLEVCSKGLGLVWQAAMGAGVSTNVSGSTYQQLFTLADQPQSLTIQRGTPQIGGQVDAYTFTGCMVTGFDLTFPNADIVTTKLTIDAGQLSTSVAYAAPSYPAAPVSLFSFVGGAIYSGTLTAPTTTALASGTAQLASVRSGGLTVNRNFAVDRQNLGGGIAAGRKAQPTVGLTDISGNLLVEYANTTFRDAILNETPMAIVLTFQTATSLSTGFETFQVVLPEVKFDNTLPNSNKTDLITHTVNFKALDNLTAAQPMWIVTRTADSAL